MSTQVMNGSIAQGADSAGEEGRLVGAQTGRSAWSASLMALLAAVSLAMAMTTPPRSGPFAAAAGRIVYPYTAAAAFVPRDYLWMYPAILMAAAFLVFVAIVHHVARSENRVFGSVGLCFAAISSTVLMANYFIQMYVLQPMLLKGETQGLAVWSQYNPHGVFIALEELGYLAMSAAFVFIALALGRRHGAARWARGVFMAAAALGLAAFVALSLSYGFDLEYRFECAIIAINWMTLVVGGVLVAVDARPNAPQPRPRPFAPS